MPYWEGLVYYADALPSLQKDSANISGLILKEYQMLIRSSLLLCVACAILLVGCAKSENNANQNAATTANTNRPAATAPATTAPATAAADKIGVPECDDFIAAYDACVSSKVPETARAQYKASIEQWRTSWKKLAENPNTRATLVSVCKQSAEQARTSMKTYNCTF